MPNTKSRACDSCYKRKIRCDASERGGVCEWCLEHDFECTFARKKQRSGPKKSSQARLKSRINTLGDFVASAYTPSTDSSKLVSTSSSSPGSRSAATSICPTCRPRLSALNKGQTLGQIFVFGQNFGVICACNGLPHLTTSCEEWVFSKTGQWPRFSDFNGEPHTTYKRLYSDSPQSPCSDSRAELPPLETVKSLFKEYINSDYSMTFPLVDRLLFEETIQMAYDHTADQESQAYLSSKACVLAFVCIVCSHYTPQMPTRDIDTDKCIKDAHLIFTEILEDTSLTALQTCYMFVLFECLCGHLQAACKYQAIAVRITMALGGHTVTYPRPKHRQLTMREREDRQLRLLFWLGYSFDKEIAIRTGQPPVIPEDYCDLTLPDGYLESHFALHHAGIVDDMQTPCLIGDLRLDLIKAKAIRNLYSASASKLTDAELIRTIRELDEDLENWRLSIPEQFAPALVLPKDIAISEELNRERSMLHIGLHLDYLHLLNTIHWASGRCLVSSQEGLNFGVNSSLDLTIEASRSIIIYLSSTAHRVVGEAFWIFIFYPISALICLFITILSDAGSKTALEDLELLRKTSKIMRSMPIRRLTSHEIEYLRRVDAFVAELSRLAEFAIQRAKQTTQ